MEQFLEVVLDTQMNLTFKLRDNLDIIKIKVKAAEITQFYKDKKKEREHAEAAAL